MAVCLLFGSITTYGAEETGRESRRDDREVTYISTPEELMAISDDSWDSGRYYELTCDLDLSGYEWTPVDFPANSTFDGKGHSIRNMTITRPQTSVGLFAGAYEGYLMNLNLEDMDIHIQSDQLEELRYVGTLIGDHLINTGMGDEGMARVENCTVSGDISVSGQSSLYSVDILACILANASDCESRVDMEISLESGQGREKFNYVQAYGLYNGGNSQAEGDILVSGRKDPVSVEVYAVNNCEGCVFEGDISGSMQAERGDVTSVAISGGKNNQFEGGVYAEAEEGSAIGYGIVAGGNSSMEGDVHVKAYGYAGGSGIFIGERPDKTGDSTNCQFIGDVVAESAQGWANASGIEGDDDPYSDVSHKGHTFKGNVTALGGENQEAHANAYGLYGRCTQCCLEGDVTAEAYNSYAYGGYMESYDLYSDESDQSSLGSDNYLAGDVRSEAENWAYAYGLYGGYGNYREGALSAQGKYLDTAVLYRTGDSSSLGDTDLVKIYENGDGYHPNHGPITGTGETVSGIFYSAGSFVQGDFRLAFVNPFSNIMDLNLMKGSARGSVYEGDVLIDATRSSLPKFLMEGSWTSACMSWQIRDPLINLHASAANSSYDGTMTMQFPGFSATAGPGESGGIGTITYGEEVPYYVYFSSDQMTDVSQLRSKYNVGSMQNGGPNPDVTVPENPLEEWEPEEDQQDVYTLCVMDSMTGRPLEQAQVYVDGKTYLTDKNGIAVVTGSGLIKSLRISVAGSVIHTESGYVAVPNQVNTLYVQGLDLSVEDILLGAGGNTVITGPEVTLGGQSFSLFELPFGFELDLLEDVAVAYDPEKRSYQVILGDYDDGSEEKIEDATALDWMEKFAQVRRECQQAAVDFAEQYYGNTINRSFGIESDVSASGYLEFAVGAQGLQLTDGKLLIKASGAASVSRPIPPAPYLFLKFGVSTEFNGETNFVLEQASYIDPKLAATADLTFTLTPSVGIGAGVDKILAAEGGIEGPLEASLKLPFTTMEESVKVSITAKVYLELTALSFQKRFSKNLAGVQLYPEIQAEGRGLTEGDLAEGMQPIGREYLNHVKTGRSAEDTIKDQLYPYGSVQSARLADGRVLLVWLDDDQERPLMDKTALYYSILDQGVWSAPAQVQNDGTADFDFSLAAKDNQAAIVWQNAREKLGEEASMEAAAQSIELSCAVFDGNAFGEPMALTTSNQAYEYSPKTYFDGTNIYASWIQNDQNSLMPETEGARESIYLATVTDGKVAEIETIAQEIPLVYETAVGAGGIVAYIADQDRDIQTGEDAVLYVSSEYIEPYRPESEISGLYYENQNFYFTQDGSVKRMDCMQGTVVPYANGSWGGNEVRILEGEDGSRTALYLVEEGLHSNLYVSYSEDYGSSWTPGVPVTDYEEKIRSWSAQLDEIGQVQIGAILADVEVGEEDQQISEHARLIWTQADPVRDLSVSSLYSEEETLKRGETAELTFRVSNASEQTLEELEMAIAGEDCGTLFHGTQPVSIEPGKTEYVTVSVDLPEDFAQQQVSVQASVPGMEEKNMENNRTEALLGHANLTVELDGDQIREEGLVRVRVSNEGCQDVADARVIVSGQDGTVFLEEQRISLGGGDSRMFEVFIDEAFRTFTEGSESYLLQARVSSGSQESAAGDNEAAFRIVPEAVKRLRLAQDTVQLRPGQTYQPEVGIYPDTAVDKTLYGASDQPQVAAVDEAGKITALEPGTAVITYMSSKGGFAKLTVTVDDQAEPEPAATHVIELEANGGTLSGSSRLEVEDGKTAILPIPLRDGYRFEGWYSAPQGGALYTNQTAIYSDCTLYARWSLLPGEDEDQTDEEEKPNEGQRPTEGTGQQTNPQTDQNPSQVQEQESSSLKKGAAFTSGSLRYRVTQKAAPGKNGQAAVTGLTTGKARKINKLKIPAVVAASATGERYQVTSIGARAFKGNKQLQQVSVGKQVKTIGKQAFQNCKKLKSVKGMFGLVQMGDGAFSGCTSLSKITLEKKVRKIGNRAFQGCKKLKNITIKSRALKTVGKQTLTGTSMRLAIRVPAAKWKAYKRLFGKKTGFRNTMKLLK